MIQRSTLYIDTLTPLRGIAAVWIFVFHYNSFLEFMQLPQFATGEISMLIRNGYIMVDLFFILSGFIITHVYADMLSHKGKGSVRKYLWARFTRLYPPHLFCMLLFLVFPTFLILFFPTYYILKWETFFAPFDFLMYLSFGVSFGILEGYSWNVPSWSIAAEWWTYIAAIAIIPLLHKMDFSRYTIAVGLFLLVGLMGIVLYGGNGNLDHTLDFGLFRCLMEFSFGIVMYQLYRRVLGSKSILASDLFFYSVTITILYLIHSNANDVLVVCLLGLLIVSASLNNGVPYKILKTKILRFFGDTSYSLYLLQTFWILSWAIWYDLYWKVNHPGVLPSTELILFWLFGIFVCLVLSAKFLHTVVEVGVRDKLRNLF